MESQEFIQSELDSVINILRSNPHVRFSLDGLAKTSGMRPDFLKKWVRVLEDKGHVKIFYSISGEEFAWIGNGKIEDNNVRTTQFPKPQKSQGSKERAVCALLGDIHQKQQTLSSLLERKRFLESKCTITNGEFHILQMQISRTKKELGTLLVQAKQITSES
ncbi:MAG: hypothetical protein WC492_03800 [Candidatus Micrarchaeia archaeon]